MSNYSLLIKLINRFFLLCVHVYMFVCVGVRAHVCACIWRPEIDVENHPPHLPYSMREGLSVKPRACP